MHWIEFKEPSFRKTLARFIKTSIYTAVEGFKSKDQPSYISKLERYFKDYFRLWEHDMEIYGKKKALTFNELAFDYQLKWVTRIVKLREEINWRLVVVFEYVNNYGWFSVKNIHSKTANQNSSCSLSFALLLASSPLRERQKERLVNMSENPFPSPPHLQLIHRKSPSPKQSIHPSANLSYKKTHIPSSPYSSPTTLSLHGIPKGPWPPHPTLQLHHKGPLEDHLGPPRPRSWPDRKAGCYWRMGENLQRGTKKFRCPAIPSLQPSRGGASCCQGRGGCDSLRSHLGANFPLFALLHKGVYQWQSPAAKGALGYHCPCWKGPFCGLLTEWWVLCFKHSGLHLCFPF